MANLITVGRVALLFGAIAMIYSGSYMLVVLAGFLIAVVFAGDGVDGWVARRRGSTSRLGAVLDIAGDRIVENVLWVVFAHLHLIGVWVPLVVLSRSFTVDVMRSVALQHGKTAFGAETMARSRLTHFLTASRFSRSYYGWSKAVAFVLLTWMHATTLPSAEGTLLYDLYDFQPFRMLVWFVVYSSVAVCVIRGLPVIYDALYYLEEDEPGTVEAGIHNQQIAPKLTTEQGEHGASS
jgi:CDP-diacylglycerol--glycerol-3-phosphate 3-phosphatidyltransferase